MRVIQVTAATGHLAMPVRAGSTGRATVPIVATVGAAPTMAAPRAATPARLFRVPIATAGLHPMATQILPTAVVAAVQFLRAAVIVVAAEVIVAAAAVAAAWAAAVAAVAVVAAVLAVAADRVEKDESLTCHYY